MELTLPSLHHKQLYLLSSANETIIGNKTIKFLQDKLISFELIEMTKSNLIFNYQLTNQFLQGSSLLHHWSADMDDLQSNMIIGTDKEGDLTDIYRLNLLMQKFEKDIIPVVKTKYPTAFCEAMIDATYSLLKDKNRYRQTFTGYSTWRFFLQNLFRKYEKTEKHPLIIKSFFSTIDLPLIVEKTTDSFENRKNVRSIKNQASLDVEIFDKKSFARMLKDLTGVFNIDASLSIDMEENYTFLKNGSLSEGEMYLKTDVPNWYSVTTAHQLKQLTSEEYDEENNNIEKKKLAEKYQFHQA